jgi:hypothetical protein
MNGMMILVLGFIAGAVIASGIWGVVWALLRNERRTGKYRTETMEEIASQCAEIDNKIVAYSVKSISETTFRSAVSPVLEKITSSLSTNMDSFDVYYVKYVESLIARYRQTLIAPVKSDQSVRNTEVDAILSEKKVDFPVLANAEKLSPELKDEQESPVAFSVEDLPPAPPKATALVDTIDSSDEEKSHETAPEPIFESVSSDVEMKDTKIIRTENIPEEKQSEIEKIIIAELNRESEGERQQEKPRESDKSEQPLGSRPQRYDRSSGTGKQAEKIVKKEEKERISPPPPNKDDSFISGEDLVAKLDSFFGI